MARKPPKPVFPPKARPEFPLAPRKENPDKVDYNLAQKINRVKVDQRLSAIIQLAPPKKKEGYQSSDWLMVTITSLIARTAREAKIDISEVGIDIFPTLDAFSATAIPRFLHILIDQPEVVRATDNNPDIDVPPEDPSVH